MSKSHVFIVADKLVSQTQANHSKFGISSAQTPLRRIFAKTKENILANLGMNEMFWGICRILLTK